MAGDNKELWDAITEVVESGAGVPGSTVSDVVNWVYFRELEWAARYFDNDPGPFMGVDNIDVAPASLFAAVRAMVRGSGDLEAGDPEELIVNLIVSDVLAWRGPYLAEKKVTELLDADEMAESFDSVYVFSDYGVPEEIASNPF